MSQAELFQQAVTSTLHARAYVRKENTRREREARERQVRERLTEQRDGIHRQLGWDDVDTPIVVDVPYERLGIIYDGHEHIISVEPGLIVVQLDAGEERRVRHVNTKCWATETEREANRQWLIDTIADSVEALQDIPF